MNDFQIGLGLGAIYAINRNQQADAEDIQYNQIVGSYIAQGYSADQAVYAANEYFASTGPGRRTFFDYVLMLMSLGGFAIMALLIYLFFTT